MKIQTLFVLLFQQSYCRYNIQNGENDCRGCSNVTVTSY